MVASGVGQYSINVKSNLRAFYGELLKTKKKIEELERDKIQLQVDSRQLEALRDKAQRIAAQIRELRQQKKEIHLGLKGAEEIKNINEKIEKVKHSIDYLKATKLRIESDPSSVENFKAVLKSIERKMKGLESEKLVLNAELKNVDKTKEQLHNLDKKILSLRRQKLEVEADIQPIRTANVELHKVEQEIARINREKVKFNVDDSPLQKVKTSLNTLSDLIGKCGQSIEKLGGHLAKLSAVSLAPVIVGSRNAYEHAKEFVKSTIDYSMDVEQAKATIRAQGVEGKKLNSIFSKIVNFANISPFDVNNMTQSVSLLNAYVGNINKSVKATEVFGTSLYAAGRDASDLQRVATNLGELNTGNFTKTDYKELVKGVPTVSQALREIGVHNWKEFTAALGDDPDTKEIEIKKNALDFVTNALEKYNKKTNALEESNKSLKAKLENTTGQFETMRDKVLNSSGAYDELKKIIDSFSNKLTSKETETALTNLFKKSIPYLKKLEDKIEKFSLNNFISGVKNGGKTIKNTLLEIKENFRKYLNFGEHLPIVGDFIKLLKSDLKSKEQGIGKFLGDFVSGSLKLGVTGIKISYLGKGINLFSTVTNTLGAGMGNLGKIKTWIAKKISQKVSQGVSDGISQGVSSGVSGSVSSKAGELGGVGKISRGLSTVSQGVGIVAKAGFAFEGLRIVDELRNTLKNYNLKQVNELYKDLPETYPDLAPRLKALKRFSESIAQVSLYTPEQNTVNNIVNAVGGIGAGLSGVPGIGVIASGVSVGAIIFKGLQVIDDLRENLKVERIKSLFSIAKELDGLDFTKLTSLKVGQKIRDLTKVLAEIYNGMKLKTMVDLGSSNGRYTLGEVIIQIDSQLPNKSVIDRVADVLGRLKSMNGSLKEVGEIQAYKNIGKGIARLKKGLIELSKALTGGDEDKKIEIGPKMQGELTAPIFSQSDQFSAIVDQAYSCLAKSGKNVEKLKEIMAAVTDLKSSLNAIQNIGDLTSVGSGITNVKNGLSAILEAFGGGQGGKHSMGPQLSSQATDFSDIVNKLYQEIGPLNEKLPDTKASIDNLNTVGKSLMKIQGLTLDQEKITTEMSIIKTAIGSLSSITANDKAADLKGISKALDTIVENLSKNFPPQFEKIGKTLATKMANSFKSNLNFSKAVKSRIQEINSSAAKGKGKTLASVINSEFESNLKIGKKIKEQILKALNQEYSSTINLDIHKNEYIKEIKQSNKKNKTKNKNSVPKKLENALGPKFFKQLQSNQISRTFAELARNISHSTTTVVNNIYNNTTNNNNQALNVYSNGNSDPVMIANRRLR